MPSVPILRQAGGPRPDGEATSLAPMEAAMPAPEQDRRVADAAEGGQVDGLVPYMGDAAIDGLIYGVRWSGGSVGYCAPDSRSDYEPSHVEAFTNFSPFSGQQMVAVHFALDADRMTQPAGAAGFSVEGFTRLDVAHAGAGSGAGEIRVANTSDPATSYAYLPAEWGAGGDVFMGPGARAPVPGNYAWCTTLHELGHALGLKHPHEADGHGVMPSDVDCMEFTVMSYRSYAGATGAAFTNEAFGFAQTYMMYDIAALQALYGADYATNAGNTVYRWSPSDATTVVNGLPAIAPGANRIFLTVWDGGGVDTYDLSAYGTDLAIDLMPGGHSLLSTDQCADLGNGYRARGNVFNALLFEGNPASLIENATGGWGDDAMKGNFGANHLIGNGGSDSLYGGNGNDTLNGGPDSDRLEGGAGDDLYILRSSGDSIVERTGGGIDRVQASVTHALAQEVEDLLLMGAAPVDGTGNALGNRLTGNGADNRLSGNRGHDVLVGNGGNDWLSGGAGRDTLTGGAGSDAFLFGAATEGGDVIGDFRNLAGNDDVLRISAAGFGAGLVAGTTLAASRFQAKADNLAQDADDRFIFRTTDRTLWFDGNGSGAGGLTMLADLDQGATLTSADILLV